MAKVDPIYLYGFCFNVQKRQRFNAQWACAFHTSWYTNERHPSWDAIDDPIKRREIRYGNTIYVLFRALVHCKRYYGPDSFWTAISKGFNTNPTIVRATVEILTEARRSQRSKPSKDVPDTARPADDWIDFLDNEARPRSQKPDPAVYKEAEAFFNSQEKKQINAARVPTTGRHPSLVMEDHYAPDRFPPVRAEDLRDGSRGGPYGRKRSASPADGPAPKVRRFEGDSRKMSRAEPDRHGALDELPTIQSTRSPPRRSEARPAQPVKPQATHTQHPQSPPSSRPTQSSTSTKPASAPLSIPTPKLEENSEIPGLSAPTGPASSKPGPLSNGGTASNAPKSPSGPKQPVPAPIHPARAKIISTAASGPKGDETKSLRAQIETLQKQLAEAKSAQPTIPAVPTPTATGPTSPTGEQMTRLTREMASATNAVSTIMDSMHDVVDRLDSLRDDVTSLSTEQKELKSTIPQITNHNSSSSNNPDIINNNTNLDAILGPIQAISTAVTTLQTQVANLQATAAPPITPTNTTTLETLLQAQTTRIDTLTREIATLQRQHLQLHPAQQQQARLSSPQSPHPQPQTLRQAIAAAERDLKYHLASVQRFYHLGGTSISVTEQTAELMAALVGGVKAAQEGARGV